MGVRTEGKPKCETSLACLLFEWEQAKNRIFCCHESTALPSTAFSLITLASDKLVITFEKASTLLNIVAILGMTSRSIVFHSSISAARCPLYNTGIRFSANPSDWNYPTVFPGTHTWSVCRLDYCPGAVTISSWPRKISFAIWIVTIHQLPTHRMDSLRAWGSLYWH